MTTSKMYPVEIDCKNLRVVRQKENNDIIYRLLKTGDEKLIRHFCNNSELKRVLDDLEISFQELVLKCESDLLFAKLLAGRISKQASRQGAKDEVYILEQCNNVLSQVDIEIENLSTTAYLPTRDGRILDQKSFKRLKIKKEDCLKSFDGKITGKVNGWIFAEVVYGKGGHQDNVFAEAHEFAEWVRKYGNDDELYVLLIDTDLSSQFKTLKEKFNMKNIMVCNHVDFQRILLQRVNPLKG
jgi:ribosomal protein L25 (general stress protein Ctc)